MVEVFWWRIPPCSGTEWQKSFDWYQMSASFSSSNPETLSLRIQLSPIGRLWFETAERGLRSLSDKWNRNYRSTGDGCIRRLWNTGLSRYSPIHVVLLPDKRCYSGEQPVFCLIRNCWGQTTAREGKPVSFDHSSCMCLNLGSDTLCIVCLTLSLLRVINVKFPLQPNQKYYITQWGELDFS